MKNAIGLVAAAAVLAGCAAMKEPETPAAVTPESAPPPQLVVVEVPRACPPLPELRAGAPALERRIHTQTIVRMYAACAGSPP